MKMGSRNELRGFLKQSQSNSEIAEDTSTKNRSLEHSDELVKYMSRLPGYLQRIEKREEEQSIVQSNVLNVGVLDWGRLEKWKHGRGERTIASTSTSGVVVDPNDTHRCSKIDEKSRKVKASRDLQHSVRRGVRCALETELASRDCSLNKQEIASCSYNKSSSGRYHERVKSRRSRSYQESDSGSLSEMGNSGGKGNLAVRDKVLQKKEAREEEKINGDSRAGLTTSEKEEEKRQFINIVLPRSRKQSRSTLSGEPLDDDDNMRVSKEVNHSIDFSDGFNSTLPLGSRIPRSCPLSLDLERDSEDIMLPISGKKERRHSNTASRIFDQELREEDESRKNRDPSPSKRFSFSFGRRPSLSRSFTSKEDSSGQQALSSSCDDDTIKSESMRFNGDGSVCQSQLSNTMEKQCGSRVSPLRRLFLDPLLKSKVSENALPSKPLTSRRRNRALFQLTLRNGIPLFQFVVDDDINNNKNRSILGATMNNNSVSSSSLKDDSVQYCTFYSVTEVKKKKSWLIHGGQQKEKQRGFVYNVIGQMLLSSDLTENIRESVLFDEAEQVKGRKEIAAVVIKKKHVEENCTGLLEETTVIIPGGVHSLPEKGGGPAPLISRWRSSGLCDCGGWDIGCKLHLLSNKTSLFDQSFKLFHQEGSEQDLGPVLEMKEELKTGIYKVEFGSFLSPLQAFFVCVTTVITCGSEEEEEETTVVKTTGKSSSPFAPPLSPVGRV